MEDIRHGLIEIAADGKVDESEKTEFQALLRLMEAMSLILSEVRLIGEKSLKE